MSRKGGSIRFLRAWLLAWLHRNDEPVYEDLEVQQVEDWLLTSYGWAPLEAVVCSNPCGCVALMVYDQPVARFGWTSDMGYPYEVV